MDIKAKINEIVSKIKNDEDFSAKFSKDPIKAIESVIGFDLPDEMIQPLVDGVKAKISGQKAGDAVNSIKNLF